MIEVFLSIDHTIFHFINGTLSNIVFDGVMPFLTDLNKTLFGKILAGTIWLLLVWKGGKKGRLVAFMLIPLIVLSDQFSSSVLKKIIARPRPCHTVEGIPILANIRLLVDCGSGFSFPSSHAVNHFAAAYYFSYFYRKWTWAFFPFAALIAFSRIYVGIHYPSDSIGGAVIGAGVALGVIGVWKMLTKYYPFLHLPIVEEKAEMK